ncbi:LysR family transcriptional regulator [Caballeronia calidae]|uniref:LysR family transcriptional regulator n=1 Tax=Caballeronia calidae TaxID=1777139 RepID=UPI004041F9C2
MSGADSIIAEWSEARAETKELEEELGAQLFGRTARSARLTRAGQLFREHVP